MNTPINLSQYSHLPLLECSHDRQGYLHPFFPTYEAASFSCPVFLNPSQQQEGSQHETELQYVSHQQQEVKEHFLLSGTSDHNSLPTSSLPTDEIGNNTTKEGDHPYSMEGSTKWMSSKMRFMRKMLNSDQIVAGKPRRNAWVLHQPTGESSNSNNNNSPSINDTIRVCSDCNTTKTPLWRSGPRGPKSLCNACGIRQRKARRAMAAAAASGSLIHPDAPTKVPNEKKGSDNGGCTAVPFKKRCNFTSAEARKKLCFDDFTVSLSENSAFHRVFPQDEKEAAILLMALSCGLIRG